MTKRIVTKEEMINTAKESMHGGFIHTDGSDWLEPTDAKSFRKYIESKGFDVIDCRERGGCSALAYTSDGYSFAFNGHCSKC